MHSTDKCLSAVLATAFVLSGCGINLLEAEEGEAVVDYIYANELKEVDQFRYFQQFTYTYVSDQYVTIPTNAGDYLIEFATECPELRRDRFTPDMADVRDDNRTLRARFDTIRGCRIGKIYEISAEQRAELSDLGDAPGDDVYFPDDDET
jgi:KaiC/GvpD/RAD55 family RecA-like ATPase